MPAPWVLAHQGEELVLILPAAMLLAAWLFSSSWASKDKPSDDSSELHEEDPETPRTEGAEPRDGA